MEKRDLHRHTDLFTLRIWIETLAGNQREWRGQVEHVMSGDSQYFRHWSTLIAFLKKPRKAGPEDRFSVLSDPKGNGATANGREGKEEEAS